MLRNPNQTKLGSVRRDKVVNQIWFSTHREKKRKKTKMAKDESVRGRKKRVKTCNKGFCFFLHILYKRVGSLSPSRCLGKSRGSDSHIATARSSNETFSVPTRVSSEETHCRRFSPNEGSALECICVRSSCSPLQPNFPTRIGI